MFEGEIPKDLPEEKLREKVEELEDKARKIGLYMSGLALNVDQEGDEDGHKRHTLLVQFGIGDVAFSPRIQDPEQDQVNDTFREIASDTVKDDIEEIRRRYLKSDEEPEEGT